MQKEMVGQRCVAYNGVNLSDLSIIATEWKPALKWLGFWASEDNRQQLGLSSGDMIDNECYDDMEMCDEDADDDDDEIEDW